MKDSLKNRRDFESVYKRGKVFSNRNFTLRCIENGKGANRLGVVVSKKVDKRAVVRNRLRRQIKACIRTLGSALRPGYDIILTAKPSCAGQDYSVLARSIRHALRSQHLLEEER